MVGGQEEDGKDGIVSEYDDDAERLGEDDDPGPLPDLREGVELRCRDCSCLLMRPCPGCGLCGSCCNCSGWDEA